MTLCILQVQEWLVLQNLISCSISSLLTWTISLAEWRL